MRLLPVVAITSVGAVAAGCTDRTPADPGPRPIGAIHASMASLQQRSHPNSEKYSDKGFKPATGRSGTATVSTRALLDKSGTTEVEVTTGTFDGPPASGTLTKVQLKASTPSGKLAFTNNYVGLAGTAASFTSTMLPRGTALQLQTLVQSADGARTDVVTTNDVVHLRPDVIAWQLQGPATAPVGAAVNLQGWVLEGNGELGARADCVLYVDGAPVDRANRIWVDAWGFVVCEMTHVFSDARTYTLELRLENVEPGDFDDANNSVTASIKIEEPSDFAAYGLQAWDITDDTWYHSVSSLLTWEGNLETWDQIYTRYGQQQSGMIQALIPRMLDYTAPITLRGEMSTNGAIVNSVDDTYGPLPFVDWQQGYCDSRYNFTTRGVTYVCVHTGGYLAGYSYIQYNWSASNIHYTSTSYVYYWDPSGVLHESWYATDFTDPGPLVTMGPDFSAWLSVQGVNDPQPLIAQATVTFAPTDLHFDYVDPLCATSPAPAGCFELHGHTYGQMGYVAYGSWPPFVP